MFQWKSASQMYFNKTLYSSTYLLIDLKFAARVKVFLHRLTHSWQNLRSQRNKGNCVKSVQGEASSASINNSRKTWSRGKNKFFALAEGCERVTPALVRCRTKERMDEVYCVCLIQRTVMAIQSGRCMKFDGKLKMKLLTLLRKLILGFFNIK